MAENFDSNKVVKRSVLISGHRTSISLEGIFWRELKDIARLHNMSVNQLVAEIDETRTGNLSSALRVFVLEETKNQEVSTPDTEQSPE